MILDYERAEDAADIFEVVKAAVWKVLRRSRAGLGLAVAELGNQPNGFIGAFHKMGSNIIVMNQTPLRRIAETNPNLYKPYIFTVLMHEYLHSLGFMDEETVGPLTHQICSEVFGKNHVISNIAEDVTRFFPNLVYPEGSPQITSSVEFVKGFDRSNTGYIG